MFQSELLVIKNQDSHVLGGRRCSPRLEGCGRTFLLGLGQHRAAPQPSSLELILFISFFNSLVQFQYKL